MTYFMAFLFILHSIYHEDMINDIIFIILLHLLYHMSYFN